VGGFGVLRLVAALLAQDDSRLRSGGNGWGGLGREVFGDGGYGAVDFVVDEFFDEEGLVCDVV
jgi:hypothetical protein